MGPRMSPQRPRAGSRRRPALRQTEVTNQLVRRIVAGAYGAGERLPTRERLMAEFDASSITIQRACDDLIDLGLVVARGPLGTFIAARPPHRHRLALVFPSAPLADGTWNRFYRTIDQTTQQLVLAGDDELTRWYATIDQPASASTRTLERQAQLGLCAGLLFAYNPLRHGADSPLARAPVPRVGVFSSAIPGISTLVLDHADYARRIATRLAERGARRVAVLANSVYLANHSSSLFAALEERGLEVRPQWRLGVDLNHPTQVTAVVRLLFAAWNQETPDALLITDDNLEDAAVAGLMSEGVRVGDGVLVIAHTNFPRTSPSPLPLLRVGFHAGSLLAAGLDELAAQRRDATASARVILIPAHVAGDPGDPLAHHRATST